MCWTISAKLEAESTFASRSLQVGTSEKRQMKTDDIQTLIRPLERNWQDVAFRRQFKVLYITCIKTFKQEMQHKTTHTSKKVRNLSYG